MGYNFPPGLSHSHYRLCLALRHILGITGRPLCNDPIQYTHKLCTITYMDVQCSHPLCWDHISWPNTLRAWSTSCSTRVTLEANSWINNCIVASYSVQYTSLTSVLVSCIGFIHVLKSRPFSSISSWGLTLLTASASATSLPWMYLISKSYSCIVSYILLDGMVHLVKIELF